MEQRLDDFRFLHQHHVAQVLPEQRQAVGAHLGDVDAVRQGGPGRHRHRCPRFEGRGQGRHLGRLHPDEAHLGFVRFDGHRHPRGQPPAPHRQDHGVQFGQVLDDLQAQGTLAGNHLGVVEGMDKSIALGHQGLGPLQGLPQVPAMENHFSPVALGGQLLGNRGPLGHDDGGRKTQLGRGEGHPLAVVAGGGGHHPRPLAPRFEQGQAVDGPPQLERPGGLEVLQLQEDFPARAPAQGMGIDQRGAEDHPGLPLPGCFNVFEGHGIKARARFTLSSRTLPQSWSMVVSPPRPGRHSAQNRLTGIPAGERRVPATRRGGVAATGAEAAQVQAHSSTSPHCPGTFLKTAYTYHFFDYNDKQHKWAEEAFSPKLPSVPARSEAWGLLGILWPEAGPWDQVKPYFILRG